MARLDSRLHDRDRIHAGNGAHHFGSASLVTGDPPPRRSILERSPGARLQWQVPCGAWFAPAGLSDLAVHLHPRIAADVATPRPRRGSADLRGTTRGDAFGARHMERVRARGLVVGPPSRLISDAVRSATDRDMAGPKLGLYSAPA